MSDYINDINNLKHLFYIFLKMISIFKLKKQIMEFFFHINNNEIKEFFNAN